jgi:hypothetical protein
MKQKLLEFDAKLPALNKNQRKVLNLLLEVGKLVEPLYKLQENEKNIGANFYPKDITKKELEAAAKKDPEILSPYTVVEKVGNKLIAIPYHVKYKSALVPIVDLLKEAATLTEDKDFSKLLEAQAKALLDGSYDEAIIARLKAKPYVLDIFIGPDDNFDDRLLGIKTSYQIWVGVTNFKLTEKVTEYKDLILSTRRKSLLESERIDNNEKVRIRVEEVVLFAGLLSKTKFVGLNIPKDLAILEKNGSDIIIFRQANNLRVKDQVFPLYKKVFAKQFRDDLSEEDLRRGNRDYIILHELAHSYLRYKNAPKSLQDLLPVIEELAATVLGMKVCGLLLVKDMVTQRELESMIMAFLCRSIYLSENKELSAYAMGGNIFLNYMLETGAIREHQGMTIPNFTKIFISLQELSSILEQLLAQGTRKDAESFIKQYS